MPFVNHLNQTSSALPSDLGLALTDPRGERAISLEQFKYSGFLDFIKGRFERSKDARRTDETRWLKAYQNWRGIYGPDVKFTDSEKSRVFVKVTKVKVVAAYSQLIDVLFAGTKFPLAVHPTPVPLGAAEAVHVDPKAPPETPKDIYGFPGDGNELPPGATQTSLLSRIGNLLGPLKDKLSGLTVREGYGQTPSAITFEPAMVAAKAVEKKIHDMLAESNASKHLRYAALECALFGSGALQGPMGLNKEYPRWDAEGNYTPVEQLVATLDAPSIWELYPDPDARLVEDCEYIIRRHKLSRSQLRNLKKRPSFRSKSIDALIALGPNYAEEYWEPTLQDNKAQPGRIERWEVLEYWGVVDRELAEQADLDIPGAFKSFEQIQISCWVSGGQIIRLVLNPYTPTRIPFLIVPYELNPYSIFGVGVAENCDDTQTLMNGFARIAVDNAVLSGNLIFEIDESLLVPGQEMKITPGKIFRRSGGQVGQSIHATKFPNTTNENLQMFDKARQLMDEATGIPSFSHGQTGVTGVGRTSGGISMLMGAAATNLKPVVKNFDDYLIKPLGESYFYFIQQFDFKPEYQGDLEIVAMGTDSLMRNEVRSQRLLQLMQVASQPTTAPFLKWHVLLEDVAKAFDLNPERLINNPEEAMRQALILQKMGGIPMQDQMGAPAGADPMDATGTGGGTIGTGVAPTPGEQGFSASPQQPQGAPQ